MGVLFKILPSSIGFIPFSSCIFFLQNGCSLFHNRIDIMVLISHFVHILPTIFINFSNLFFFLHGHRKIFHFVCIHTFIYVIKIESGLFWKGSSRRRKGNRSLWGDIVIKYIIYLNSSVIIRAMGTAQWAKCMLCKYEDLSSDPKNPCKAGLVVYVYNQCS